MRLDRLSRLEGDGIAIEWRSFLLRPVPTERDESEFRAYTLRWQRPAGMEPDALFTIPWTGGHAPPSHSLPAAVAGKVVERSFPERFDDFHHRLLRAYFSEHRTISEMDVLADVAAEAGVARDHFCALFEEQYRTQARAAYDQHNEAVNAGIQGVPAVVVDGRYLVTGAVEVAHYQAAVAQARADRGP